MSRVILSVSVSPELNEILKSNVDDVSQYFRSCIERDFMDENMIKSKIKEHEEKIEELKRLKPMDKKKEECNQDEREFLRSAKERLNRDPGYLNGIFMQYKNLFGKKISIEKFRELLQ